MRVAHKDLSDQFTSTSDPSLVENRFEMLLDRGLGN